MSRVSLFASVAALLFSVSAPFTVFAVSYLPGQTLNPSCLPSDPTCLAVPNTTSGSFTATFSSATSTFAGGAQVAGTASSTNVVVSGSLTLGNLSGILKAVAGVITSTLVNLASDVTGILGNTNGGAGTSTAPTYGQVLVGNGSGGYALTATSSLGIAGGGGVWGSITGSLASQLDLQNALNGEIGSSTISALTTNYDPYWNGSAFANGAIYDTGSLIGIGATTPGSILSINGVANWTTATSTFYSTGGINLSGGCFSIGGTCVGATSGSDAVSTGAQGQFAFYNAAGAALAATSSIFLSSSGNVGIGTTTPNSPLVVTGTMSLGSTGATNIRLGSENATTPAMMFNSVTGIECILETSGGFRFVYNQASVPASLDVSGNLTLAGGL